MSGVSTLLRKILMLTVDFPPTLPPFPTSSGFRLRPSASGNDVQGAKQSQRLRITDYRKGKRVAETVANAKPEAA
ncbi:hypothetical protein LEP1GSC050_0596 [Leptospira broomii serovar Hurstbridge str. 5399]|uniref:Uncharacterized protein n=1 Tax=Leptospira broomii serovar Hurstbridge str. 5399 TaxID=1049789 RepID=T0GJV7_9LEPT|nr:hypothetical protein LEP1GSC050_0596 [Leptospira broomii serovar Hurstbridge str. 5399]